MAKDQLVVTLIGAANRDPEVYDRPDTFDVMRDGAAGHLAFSSGIHYCLGQSLARLEAAVALRVLAQRIPAWPATGRYTRDGAVQRRNATTIRGPLRLPVTAGPAPARVGTAGEAGKAGTPPNP